MTPDQAIARMRAPAQVPKGCSFSIIQIDVTNRCDLRCSNCTRFVHLPPKWDMTPENYRRALQSMRGYPYVIGMIGGNPCLHPAFEELCHIFVEEVPDKSQRWLFANNVFKYQELVADTFGGFNLNPHGDPKSVASLEKLQQYVPGLRFYAGNSHHAPILTAIRDVEPDESKMWAAIAACDFNATWSASIIQNNGKLRAYFCEEAAAFDVVRGEDHGHEVVDGWWRARIDVFGDQIKHFCPGCGVPARLKARLDTEETDDYSVSNTALATRGRKRKVKPMADAVKSEHLATSYSESMRAPVALEHAMRISVSVIIPCYNAEDTIAETVLSVAGQQVPANVSVDVIVVDDQSTDRSREVVEQVAKDIAEHAGGMPSHCTVRGMVMPRNSGPAAARNRGLRASQADYVVFLDSDDWLAQGFLWVGLHGLYLHPEIAAMVTDIELVDSHREVLPAQLNAMVWSMPSNMIVRRSIADLMGGFPEDEAYRGPAAVEDMVFKQALTSVFRVGYLKYPFLRYRVKKGSHFDLFLDTTTQGEDGELKYLRESDDRIDVATAIYYEEIGRRLGEIESARVKPDDGETHIVPFEMNKTPT